ncbi:hypothetical protein D9757_012905 [Collybiopsis confluens]|uniref:DUF6534 domain-containing protein n=1 Tax=Collybiopsis confluens TaxID=2823264 RepID=A0A8H5D8Q3_9AGAR|nr:hypothetical protein D9757_012905 [Collybiopsis confluens]
MRIVFSFKNGSLSEPKHSLSFSFPCRSRSAHQLIIPSPTVVPPQTVHNLHREGRRLSVQDKLEHFKMASEPTVFHIQLQYGPMLIGVFLNMILYGVLLNQMYFYYKTYTDSIWIRLFVSYLFFLETANTCIDMAMIYQPLVAEFGTLKAVQNFPTLFLMEPIFIVAISTPIQIFFARRILKITKSYWIPGIIVALALASCAGGFITGVKIEGLKLFSKKPELHWSALLWFLTSCVADLLITAALVLSLSQRKTGYSYTDSVVDKIIKLAVQTGMVTSICAVGDVAFFMALPHNGLNFIWDLTLAKLYTNCLMSTLNARAGLMKSSENNGSSGLPHRNPLENSSSRRERESRVRPKERFGFPDATSPSMVSAPSNVYELENTKTFEAAVESEGRYSPSSYHRDVEFGITVTKVVERMEDRM